MCVLVLCSLLQPELPLNSHLTWNCEPNKPFVPCVAVIRAFPTATGDKTETTEQWGGTWPEQSLSQTHDPRPAMGRCPANPSWETPLKQSMLSELWRSRRAWEAVLFDWVSADQTECVKMSWMGTGTETLGNDEADLSEGFACYFN